MKSRWERPCGSNIEHMYHIFIPSQRAFRKLAPSTSSWQKSRWHRGCYATVCHVAAGIRGRRGPTDSRSLSYLIRRRAYKVLSAMTKWVHSPSWECNRCPYILSASRKGLGTTHYKVSQAPEPDVETVFEDIRKGAPPPTTRDRGLTVQHLTLSSARQSWSGYEDRENVCFWYLIGNMHLTSLKSFFTVYRNLFSRIAYDESRISDVTYPSFGYSTWPWSMTTIAQGDETARAFYNAWTNFVTSKDFFLAGPLEHSWSSWS